MKITERSAASAIATALTAVALVMGPVADAAPGCAKAKHPGGDWPSFGHDLSNTRYQSKEKEITPDTAAMIMPKWRFSIASAEADGNF